MSVKILYIFLSLLIFSCKKDEVNTLLVSKEKIEIPAEGGNTTFTIETDAGLWSIENPASDWIKIPITSGTNDQALISVSVDSRTLTPRTDTLIVTAGNAKPFYVIVSQVSSEYLYDLSTNRSYAEFAFVSGSVTMNITSGAPEWTLICDADWVQLSQSSGAEGAFTVSISVSFNHETTERSTTIVLSGNGTPAYEIPVKQKGTYPSYNTDPIDPDMTGMNSTAVEIAANIKLGYNIGNTLEAMGSETSWGNPKITESFIQLVKQSGFNAIRLPCSWNQYADQNTAKIKDEWLNRVKEVVQYCDNNDMYVILNIHWDGGWLEQNCVPSAKDGVNAKQRAFWEQIATKLRDFDEHLMFASANEPNVKDDTQMGVLMSYHQTFVNAVRSTGGKNTYRVLIVQGPTTDIETTNKFMKQMPTDYIANRLMAEIHYYTPYQFCLMTQDANWGKMFYYWGEGYHSTTDLERNANWGEESTLIEFMGLMKSQFVDNGIPVILGEFAVVRRSSLTGENLDLHLASRAYYLKYLTKQAKSNGLLPFYWDAGNMGENASALFNRLNNTVYDQQALNALIEGSQ